MLLPTLSTCLPVQYKQGLPRQLHGRTIFVGLFKDIPLRDYVYEYLSFESGGQTQHVVRDFVKQLTKSEAENHGGALPSSAKHGLATTSS